LLRRKSAWIRSDLAIRFWPRTTRFAQCHSRTPSAQNSLMLWIDFTVSRT